MNYVALRRQIYQHEISQLLAAIRDFGLFIAAVCYQLIIPMFLILPIFMGGQIAEADTSTTQRLFHQSVYLLLSFTLLKIQAKAITGGSYQYYLTSIPASVGQKVYSHIKLCLIGGNLVLLSPLVLCFFMPNLAVIVSTRHLIFFTLMVLLISQTAILRTNPPIISLAITPLLSYFAIRYYPDLQSNALTLAWLIIMVIEFCFVDKVKFNSRGRQLTHYNQMLLLFMRHRRANVVGRSFGVVTIMALFYYYLLQRPDFDLPLAHYIIASPIAIFVGSYQFEIERFRNQYRYYRSTFPLSNQFYRLNETLPLALLSLLTLSLGGYFLHWGLELMLIELILISATAWGVRSWGRFYFIANITATGIIIALLN